VASPLLADPDSPIAAIWLGDLVHRDTVCQIRRSFQTPEGDASQSNRLRMWGTIRRERSRTLGAIPLNGLVVAFRVLGG